MNEDISKAITDAKAQPPRSVAATAAFINNLPPATMAEPCKVKRCVYCGAKVVLTTKHVNNKPSGLEPTMFHKLGCKVDKTLYPDINHGTYTVM
jgi:hypothetical protein